MAVLIVVSGPPGVGKSSLADAVVALRPATRLSIDDVEDAMLACGLSGTGVAAYEVVRAAAQQNLAIGQDVVVDAVNDSEPARATWSCAAAATDAQTLLVVLGLADAEAHRARLEGRSRPFRHLAEPRWSAVLEGIMSAAPWEQEVPRLDAALPVDELARTVLAQVPPSTPADGAA